MITERATADFKKVIKLSVEIPLKMEDKKTNDLAIYFKRFATILLVADTTLSILNWDDEEQNPIKKSGDIQCSEETVKQYFSGMRIIQSRWRVQGFVKIMTLVPFGKTKSNPCLWTWLTTNKVFV